MAHDRFQPEGGHLCYDIQHHRGTCRLHRIHLGPFRSFIYNWAPSVSAIFTFLDSFDNTTSTPFLCQRKRSTSPRHCLCSCSHSPLCGSRHSWRLSYPVGSEDPQVPHPGVGDHVDLGLPLCGCSKEDEEHASSLDTAAANLLTFFWRGKQFRNYCDTHVLPFHSNSIRIQQQSPCQRFTRPNWLIMTMIIIMLFLDKRMEDCADSCHSRTAGTIPVTPTNESLPPEKDRDSHEWGCEVPHVW